MRKPKTSAASQVDYFTGEGESEHAGSSAEDDDNAGLSGLAEADLQELMRREVSLPLLTNISQLTTLPGG